MSLLMSPPLLKNDIQFLTPFPSTFPSAQDLGPPPSLVASLDMWCLPMMHSQWPRQEQLWKFCWWYRSQPDLQCFSWPCLMCGTTGDRKVILLKQVPPSLLRGSLLIMLSNGRCTLHHTAIARWLWRSCKKTLKKPDTSCGTVHLNPTKTCTKKYVCNCLQTQLYLHK